MNATHKLSRRMLWPCALIALLLLLAYKAGTEGLSNFYAQSAHMEIERWSKPGYVTRSDESARVMQYLARSIEYSPRNPWPLEEMGTLQLRVMNAARDAQLAETAARSANLNFRQALAERPTSPFAWANFALSKLYLGEQDDALFRALARAEELGPWEPQVQQSVVFVGLAVWHRLDAAQQAAVVRAMRRGAKRNPARMAEIAMAFSRIDLYCALGYIAPNSREVCAQISKSGNKPKPQK